ncbi:MAG: hypothetical protein C0592_04780 [Marinilabiliales bacterium]|nr:MAG: hypothetical protein C0592_04780 [Marinilabiliales bacterium]
MKAQYDFYSAVVSDMSTASPYFPMKLDLDGTETWVIVQNSDFYRFVLLNEITNEKDYFAYAVGFLNGTVTYKYNANDYSRKKRLNYLEINFYPDIVETAEKGKEYFQKRYLKDGFINVPLEKEPLIVYFLFQWNIAVYNECESGNLTIKFEM